MRVDNTAIIRKRLKRDLSQDPQDWGLTGIADRIQEVAEKINVLPESLKKHLSTAALRSTSCHTKTRNRLSPTSELLQSGSWLKMSHIFPRSLPVITTPYNFLFFYPISVRLRLCYLKGSRIFSINIYSPSIIFSITSSLFSHIIEFHNFHLPHASHSHTTNP